MLACVFFTSGLPGSRIRVWLMRFFGAQVGQGVVVKPRVRITFPWRVSVGDHSWIGEGTWLDSLDHISIGSNCCLSQGVYICTGNHDWSSETFDLVVKPVNIYDGAWIGAYARLSPGVTIGQCAVVSMGAVQVSDAEPNKIYAGNPAVAIKERK